MRYRRGDIGGRIEGGGVQEVLGWGGKEEKCCVTYVRQ